MALTLPHAPPDRIGVFPRTFGISTPIRACTATATLEVSNRRNEMRPILLATDGSPSADEATREALDLAAGLDVPLVATAVEQVHAPAYGYYGYAEVYSELRKGESEHVRQVLDEVAARAAALGIECETVALDGIVVDEICRLAQERDAQLVVAGAHGWGPIRRFVFGSVSTSLLHEAPCPVLVARAGARARASVS
jgi:nucleotide-binding universal stress UspA family protein